MLMEAKHIDISTRSPAVRGFRAYILSIVSVMLLSSNGAVAAVELDANVAGVFTDLSFSTPTTAVLSNGDSSGGLSVGNGVLIHVDVTNADAHDVRALFVTLNFDPSKLVFLSNAFQHSILVTPNPFGVDSLVALDVSPDPKVSDSSGSSLIGLNYADLRGTDGPGPDLGRTWAPCCSISGSSTPAKRSRSASRSATVTDS
jgi:hypothetical protein